MMLSDYEREDPVSDTAPAAAVLGLAEALRVAQGGALQPSTMTMLAQLASDMARLPSTQALASPRSSANAGVFDAVARVARPTYELPRVTRMIDHIPTRLTGSDVARRASLASTFASVRPTSSISDMIAKMGLLDGPNKALAVQLSQLLGNRDALTRVAATAATYSVRSAMTDAFASGGLSARNALVAGQAAQIISAQDSITRLAATTNISASMAGLLDSISRYSQVQADLSRFAVDIEAPVMLRGYTALAGRRYDSYLDSLPARPIARRAAVARFGGNAQTGLLVAEALTSDVDDDEREDLTERFAAVSLEAWQRGPADVREDLFTALDELGPDDLAGWLKSAWEDIDRNGYKAASKIANATVECIDRTLRVLSPVDDVLAWMTDQPGSKTGWLDAQSGSSQSTV